MKKIFYTVILACLILSCERSNINDPIKEDKKSLSADLSNILSFESITEYIEAQKVVNSLSEVELKNYEESKGYKSFGRLCDEFYKSIDPEEFTSIEMVKAFVSSNRDYLQLIEDANGEFTLETVLSFNSNRYLLNGDKMFIIGEIVYKVFEEGTAMTNVVDIEMLKHLKEPGLLNKDNEYIHFIPNHPISMAKDAAYNCGMSANNPSTEDRDRTVIEISIDYLDSYDINGVPQTVFQNRVLVRPYKRTLGIWYWCSRTISCDVKVAVDVLLSSGVYDRSFHYISEPGKYDSKLEYVIDGGIVSWGYWTRYSDMHYGGYDAWGDTPSVEPPAQVQCNTDLF